MTRRSVRFLAGAVLAAAAFSGVAQIANACVPPGFFRNNEYYRAMQELRAGNKEKAIELLRKVAEGPGPAFQKQNAALQLGKIALDGGDRTRAIAFFEKVLRSQPSHTQARLYLGIAHAQSSDFAAARKNLEMVKTAMDWSYDLHHHLAVTLVNLGDFAAAKPHAARAGVLGNHKPTDVELLRNIEKRLGGAGQI
jgi:tetratricopeptide (TPR) repeat protein